MGLLTFYKRGGLLCTQYLFIPCFGCFVSGKYVVILLLGNSVFLQQFLKTAQFTFSVFHLYTYLFDTGIADAKVILSGSNTDCGCLSSGCSVCQIRFCLCHTETKFRILDDDESVTFVHRLILFKTYFLDKSRHTGIDRSNMLFYLRIVGVFNPSKMDESGTNIGDTADKKTKNQNVVYNLPVFSSYHNCNLF